MPEDISRGATGATLAGRVPAPIHARRYSELPTRGEQLAARDAARCDECGEPRIYCGHDHA